MNHSFFFLFFLWVQTKSKDTMTWPSISQLKWPLENRKIVDRRNFKLSSDKILGRGRHSYSYKELSLSAIFSRGDMMDRRFNFVVMDIIWPSILCSIDFSCIVAVPRAARAEDSFFHSFTFVLSLSVSPNVSSLMVELRIFTRQQIPQFVFYLCPFLKGRRL